MAGNSVGPKPGNNKHRRTLVPDGISECFVEVQGHKVRYLTGGSGQAAILVSGLLGFSFSFSENLAPLSQHFTVFGPDLLNTGYSERADVSADLTAEAIRLRDFMDAVGIDRADVVGASYGGTIAMALAAIAPERIRTLVLVAPAHCDSETRGRWQVKLFSSSPGLWLSRIVRFAPPLLHGFFIKRMYGDPSRALPGTVSEYAKAISVPGTSLAAARVMRKWKANFEELCRMMPRLRNVDVRLIWGDKDPVVPVSTAKELTRELPRATLSVIATAGHLPFEELPEEFNKMLLDVLLNKTAK